MLFYLSIDWLVQDGRHVGIMDGVALKDIDQRGGDHVADVDPEDGMESGPNECASILDSVEEHDDGCPNGSHQRVVKQLHSEAPFHHRDLLGWSKHWSFIFSVSSVAQHDDYRNN